MKSPEDLAASRASGMPPDARTHRRAGAEAAGAYGVRPTSTTEIAIVGAGPYGLSLASHLSARGAPFRVFGSPMRVWQRHMPHGMCLKSDGFASDLYDPERRFTLERFCHERGIRYADYGTPVPVEVFAAYGLAFQKRLVPTLSEVSIDRIERRSDGFVLHADNGETIAAKRVVLATGISGFSVVPEPLKSLPADLCSHSVALNDLSAFVGKRVLIVGGGASATDLAALLAAQGTPVVLVSRKNIEFHRSPEPPSLWKRITEPNLGLGPNFRSALYTAFPGLFRRLPALVRRRIVSRHLGPSGAWFVRDQVLAAVPMHIGYAIAAASPAGGGVRLRLEASGGRSVELHGDHVIAATGYSVSVDRIDVLDPTVRASITTDAGSPILSNRFESSVPGLYFVGVTAAASFGPVMRFALGADYTSRYLSSHLAAQ